MTMVQLPAAPVGQNALLPVEIRGVADDNLRALISAPPTILDPTTASYSFGRTISRQFLAIQVLITNGSHANDLIVHEISLEITAGEPENTKVFEVSSLDKTVLQGVSERGQSIDPRNVWLRIFRGLGTTAAALSTFARVGPSFAPGVASFNGPFVDAYSQLFPDYTVQQINRLNNAAFDTNKVIPKERSAKVVIFVPLAILMDSKTIRQFRQDPHSFFTTAIQNCKVIIDGTFVQPVSTPGT